MRKSLIGYYPPSEEELQDLWKTGLIVLDANVLLNLYRYSTSASSELLRLLDRLKERLWIPYQVAMEYHKNRLEVIREQCKSCEDFLKPVQALMQGLDQPRRHPFVTSPLQEKLKKVVEELQAEIEVDTSALSSLRRSDPILDQITAIYEGRVGAPPDAAKKESWSKDGEERFRLGIPPGFEDRKKADERRFGDLYLWMELLEHCKKEMRPVIFVTDDAKKDWWREHGGETIGPHPALKSEIVAITSKPFHMYRPERFVEFAGKQTSQKLSPKVVEEVKEAQAAAQEAARARVDLHSELDRLALREEFARRQEIELQQRELEERLRMAEEFDRRIISQREYDEYLRRKRYLEQTIPSYVDTVENARRKLNFDWSAHLLNEPKRFAEQWRRLHLADQDNRQPPPQSPQA